MWKHIILISIWIGFFVHWLVRSIPNRRFFEVFTGLGIGLCLTILDFGIFGWFASEQNGCFFKALSVLGDVLTIAAIALVVSSLLTLGHRGKPRQGIERTTVLIDTGIFKFVRHPLYLGGAIWSVALILQTKLLIPTILGVIAFLCFLIGSIREDVYNERKFGQAYRRYKEQVAMWNLFKRIFR